MSEVKVMFNTLEDIRKYLRALDSFNGDLDLQYESQIVDGKSLLGILSLGIGKLLNLKAHYGNPDELMEKIGFCQPLVNSRFRKPCANVRHGRFHAGIKPEKEGKQTA